MKFKLFLLTLVLLAAVTSTARADKPEFRALWVHNWLPGILSPAEADGTIRWAKDTNMNALVVQVRRLGDAYYKSSIEPRASNIQGADYDPLDYVIEQAHPNKLEVHAWVNLFRVCSKAGVPADQNHVANAHPEWLSKEVNGTTLSEDGMFLDPGVPEARAYLVKVISDLVTSYDIDGLMLDYVRYPGKEWGYNDIAVEQFNRKYGRTGKPAPTDPDWCDWRRQQVTETVRAISSEVRRLKPYLKISAATIAWGKCPSSFEDSSPYSVVFQDWRSWMQSGLIDANMPMNYKDPANPKQNQWFADWVDGAKRWSYGRHVYCGLMIYNGNVPGTANQVQLARTKGADGVVGLAFSQLDCRDALEAKLKSSVFARNVPLPTMSWKNATTRTKL